MDATVWIKWRRLIIGSKPRYGDGEPHHSRAAAYAQLEIHCLSVPSAARRPCRQQRPCWPCEPVPHDLERSYWVHASLGPFTQQNYFGPQYPATILPTQREIRNAAGLLIGRYGANRLYLIYHKEMPFADAQRVFEFWRAACPPAVEVVPALVLRMYDKDDTQVFTPEEANALVDFFRARINPNRVAIYDVHPSREQGPALDVLAKAFPTGLIRLGLQPGERLKPPFTSAVEDTWSGFCHGKDNEKDWLQGGFGAETLRTWVAKRNDGGGPVSWNLITVAWDYRATKRGEYPRYDDANKNMPLPAGRNALAVDLIRRLAKPAAFGGFSSDLYILHENSRSTAHDGRDGSFYQTLKAGRVYQGYYAVPLEEIAQVYRRVSRETGQGSNERR